MTFAITLQLIKRSARTEDDEVIQPHSQAISSFPSPLDPGGGKMRDPAWQRGWAYEG